MVAGDTSRPTCWMEPYYLKMRFPDPGFRPLQWQQFKRVCDEVPANKWTRKPSGSVDLFVHADGPSGSEHNWQVTIGIGGKQDSKPIRGVCIMASTLGQRTLQRYKEGPLPWLDDLDNDGKAEVVLWDSFVLTHPVPHSITEWEYGLVAWVYRLVTDDSLVIDWDLSRRMAGEITKAYRVPVPLAPRRTNAAEALEQFADEGCSIVREAPTD
jgi:hypothetical protein